MYIIHAIAIAWFFAAFVVCMIGIGMKEQDVVAAGVFMIAAGFFFSLSFEIGAHWQADDVLSKYQLIELKTP